MTHLVPSEGARSGDDKRLRILREQHFSGYQGYTVSRWARMGHGIDLVIRIQSPKTGTNSGDTCDMEGCALANNT
jgi:hypothetical protein